MAGIFGNSLIGQIAGDTLGGAAAFAGHTLGLPELGVSEALQGGGKAQTVTNGLLNSNSYGAPVLGLGGSSAPKPAATQNNPSVLGAMTVGQPLSINPPSPQAPTPVATQQPTTGGGGSASAAPDTNALLASGTQGINDNFNAFSSGIDQIKSSIEKQIQDLQNGVGSLSDQINGQYNPNLQSLQSQQQQANQQVDTSQTNSIRDLEDNLRNQYAAANRQLGSVGAGDSSAVGQYAQAIANQGAKARAQLMQQAQQLHTQIGQQYSNQLNQLNAWKSNQILSLVNKFKDQQAQLDQQKIGANTDRVQQINALKQQLQQQASAALQGVDQTSSYWQNQLNSSMQNYQNQVAQIHGMVSGPQIDPTQFQALGNTALQYTGPGGAQGMTVQGQPVDYSALIANPGLQVKDPNQIQF
jgi:hypothetical protein